MLLLGSDHAGFELKEFLKEFLDLEGIAYKDVGPSQLDPTDDYPDIAFDLGFQVMAGEGKGVLICGSGVGVTIAANKVKGVRAGLCHDRHQVVEGVADDDMNVLCISAKYTDAEDAAEMLEAFMEAEFSEEERHVRRVNKIKKFEIQ